MTDKPTKAKGPGKSGPKKPRKAWESQYPDYPNLLGVAELVDYEGIIERVEDGGADELDNELHDAAILMRVIDCLRNNRPLHPKDARDFADRFTNILVGMAWKDAFHLPGRDVPAEWNVRSPKDQRDLDLFCDVENARRSGADVTKAIGQTAAKFCVSYETARAAYYAWRDQLSDHLSNFPENVEKD